MDQANQVPYDRSLVSAFYDGYGDEEWKRLEATAGGRLMLAIHLRFLRRHAPNPAGLRVLDAGSGPGRFAIELARAGARVTLLDLSPGQLAIARSKVEAAGLADRIEGYVVADVSDLSALPTASFDLTICLGGSLNYPIGREAEALQGLARVTRPDEGLIVGVMSLWGGLRHALGGSGSSFIGKAEENRIWEVLESGTLPALPHVRQPPRHFFTSGELAGLLDKAGCEVVEMASAPCLASALYDRLEEIAQDEVAWANLVELEGRASTQPGLLDVGGHLLAAARLKASH